MPGSPDLSLLVDKVAEGEMPPKGALRKDQVTAVRTWVEAGATYASEPLTPRRAGADWWSLRPIRTVSPPESHGNPGHATDLNDWIETPIDAFILAGLRAKGLTPAPAADPATLIRRVTFDLTGLPPTPDAVDAFVADMETDPRAFETLVDKLLASPQYGERRGRHWLDVVRFGESQGYETNLPRPGAWPYRDYVILRVQPRYAFSAVRPGATGRRSRHNGLAFPGGDRVPGWRDARYRRQPDDRGNAPAAGRRFG